MKYAISPFAYQFAHFHGTFSQNLVTLDPHNTWAEYLARLRHEKGILENGLANCVKYLCVLRKKQARNERPLSVDPQPPRKKRKKMQQSKRELEREVRNREREERAFLSNLQACKANIYLAEGIPFISDFSSTVADYTSSMTQCSYNESEPTEISWSSWTDDKVISPLEKQSNNPFFATEVAPDEFVEGEDCETIVVRDIRRPPLLIRDAEEMAALQVSLNTARSHYRQSSLSPTAALFEPILGLVPWNVSITGRRMQTFDALPLPPNAGFGAALARRATAEAICQEMQELSIHTQADPSQKGNGTWRSTNPQ